MIFESITELGLSGVYAIRFRRHLDKRGYFVETFRKSQFRVPPLDRHFVGSEFLQCNESFSLAGTIRGLHFQWNPAMGKLVRTVHGHMVDLVADIRPDSATVGKIIAHDMPESRESLEWIWVPPGFAHGNFFLSDTRIEYMCTGEHNPECEAGISPFAADLDWGACDSAIKDAFEALRRTELITDKDRQAMSVREWLADSRTRNFRSREPEPV